MFFSGTLLLFWWSSQFSSVQLLSPVRPFATPWSAAHQASLSIINSLSSYKLLSIEWVMPSNHLMLCHPLLLLPSVFPGIRVFSSEFALHTRWPEYWSFSFSISPSSEYSGLICFRIDWFDLLEHYWTLKSFLQHHSLKASVAQSSAFFLWSNSLICTWLLGKPQFWFYGPLLAKWCLSFLIHCLGLP